MHNYSSQDLVWSERSLRPYSKRGRLFIALCNGLDDEAQGARPWACLRTSPNSTNFSPSERDAFYTTLKMADDVFLGAAKPKSDRSHLRLVN